MTIHEFEEDERVDMNERSVCAYMETKLYIDDDDHQLAPPLPPPIPPVSCLFSRLSSDRRLPSSRGRDLGYLANPKSTRTDFLSLLPPEISVYILTFLHPRHLCRVVQVSKTWRWLAQYGHLRSRRLRYIKHKREKYLRAKENIVGFRQPTTPQAFTRTASLHECTPSHPLTSIENSKHRFSRPSRLQSPYIRDGETPAHLARHNGTSSRRSSRHSHQPHHHQHYNHHQGQSPQFRTPEDGIYRRAEDADPVYMVRRCLFPSHNTPPPAAKNQVKHTTPPDEDPHDGLQMTTDNVPLLSTKKSASKRRLKRL